MFVKPANLGSSIGVSKVNNETEMEQALEIAFHYDNLTICEQAVQNPVELNCSILADKGEIKHSLIEKIATKANFLSFDEKYLNQGGTMQGIEEKVQSPAKIPPHVETHIYELCKQVANALHIDGGAPRIDFLRDEKTDKLYVNEINTIPGSMQLHLRESSGIKITEFFNILIENAFWRQEQEKQKSIEFNSSIVDLTVNFKK
jgi:D-alanine-D-alanine ligase